MISYFSKLLLNLCLTVIATTTTTAFVHSFTPALQYGMKSASFVRLQQTATTLEDSSSRPRKTMKSKNRRKSKNTQTPQKVQEEVAAAMADADEIVSDVSSFKYEMPWSELQEWALRDNLSRFTVQIATTSGSSSSNQKKTTMKVFILWRNLCSDVPELTGYPIDFLRERHADLYQQKKTPIRPVEETLPFLDNFQFETAGGLTGNIYGIAGIADGTRITTNPVTSVETTIPKNFVQTEDGSVIYELGRHMEDKDNAMIYSLDGTTVTTAKKFANTAMAAKNTVQNEINSAGPLATNDNVELLYIGGLTAALIGSAVAIQTLSHHLTVNVFWV